MARPVAGRGSTGSVAASASGPGAAATASSSSTGFAASASASASATSRAAAAASASSSSPKPLSPEESDAALRSLGFGSGASRFSEMVAMRSGGSEGGAEEASGEDGTCSASGSIASFRGLEDVAFCQQAGSGLRRRLISPFEVHFSQSHIRPEFQDGRGVEETTSEIERDFLSQPKGIEAAEELGVPSSSGGGWWLLRPPFPEIEVIQWRCKLRKEDGSTRTDEMGMELYGDREWYTLDNRRLYCLQRAAAKVYPAEVRCAVIVIRQEDGNCREFRKFRTPDLGRTVGIGHRDAEAMPRWSWRKQVGLPEQPLPTGQAIVSRHARRRGPGSRGPHSGDRRGSGRHFVGKAEEEQEETNRWDPVVHVAFFVLIYALLRLGLRLVATAVPPELWPSFGGFGARSGAFGGGEVAGALQPPPPPPPLGAGL